MIYNKKWNRKQPIIILLAQQIKFIERFARYVCVTVYMTVCMWQCVWQCVWQCMCVCGGGGPIVLLKAS